MTKHPQKTMTKHTVRYMWQHAWRYKKYVVGAAVALPITVLVNQILPPLVLANVLGRLSRHDYVAHDVWGSFGPTLLFYGVVLMFGGSLMWRIVDHFMWRIEGSVEKDIAEEVFTHLIDQSAAFHSNNFSGSLVSQTNKLMGGYIRVQDTTMFQVIPLVLGIVFSAAVLLHVAPIYAGILIAFSIVYVICSLFITRKVRQLSTKHSTLESKQTGLLADAITNAMAIKSFAGRNYELRHFSEATETTRSSLLRFSKANQRQQFFFGSLLSTISGLALVMAVVSVLVFGSSVATVFLIFTYTAVIAEQLFQFSNSALRSYNRAIGDASDMIAILRQTPEIQDPQSPETVRITRGDIVLKNVRFQHDGSEEPIFSRLNLHIKPGEKVGLVGHSGSGKTTFTRILQRFSDIQEGEILIDGQNIANITQDDLHRHIAYVPQEPLLFHRSITDNIRYGNENATEQEVVAVAKMASAHDFVSDLPKGYDTLVGERGVKLSGGQRQRIAIARAMLKNAPILTLDEATSALDSESEVLIQEALWKLMEGRTAIVIAHRLSTIQKMDRIIVLDRGQIVEQGSHKELINQNGTYAKLWAHQSGGFMEE
ncbi:ABC transporter ATP-binding protein [soil metagenome]